MRKKLLFYSIVYCLLHDDSVLSSTDDSCTDYISLLLLDVNVCSSCRHVLYVVTRKTARSHQWALRSHRLCLIVERWVKV